MAKTFTVNKNLLGEEKISKLMIRFSIPAIISMLVNAIYNIVDQIFIGQGIGELGMAATNVAFPLTTISTAVGLLLGIGGASNFSLSLGRKQEGEAAKIAANAVSGLVVMGTLIGLATIAFLEPLLYAFGATQKVMQYAVPYTFIIAIGLPFFIFTTGICHLIRADGSPTYSMICMLAGAIFNIIFDPIFMFALNMGIEGIALATTLGQMLSSTIGLFYLFRFKSVKLRWRDFKPSLGTMKKISALGIASCVNQLAMTVVQIASNNTLTHYGAQTAYSSEIPLASAGAISKVMVVSMSFVIGTAQGCQPITGYNYGAKKYDRVRKAFLMALSIATGFSVITFLAFQFIPREIISIFGGKDANYFVFAVRYMRIYLLMSFLNGIQPVAATFFTSIGKATHGLWLSLVRQILLLLPMLLVFPLFFGLDGVMYAGPVSDAIAALLCGIVIYGELKRIKKLEMEQVGGVTVS